MNANAIEIVHLFLCLQTVQVVDENTDISHNITNEAVGGLVSSR